MRALFSPFAALVTAAAFALASCGEGDAANAAPQAPLVEVVAVASSDAPGAIRASGLVGYKIETELSFNAPGVIEALTVDEGDTVRRGQRLATLRRTSVGANPNESALAQETAERNLRRTQALFDQGFATQAALDDARLAVERSRDSSRIDAPTSGIILRRSAEPAQTVGAGQSVLTLGDVASGVVVRAALASNAAARVRVGDAAQIRISGESAPREGRVARVSAKSDDATGAFEAEIRVADARGLRSGLVADVTIAAQAGVAEAAAIVVPTLSLIDARADQGVVFVVDEGGVARRRSVETGGVTRDGVLVLAGLNAGERVVATGVAYVRDGAPVRIAAAPQ